MSAFRYYRNLNESFAVEEPSLPDGLDGVNRIQKSIRLLSGEMIAASAPWTSPAPAGSPHAKDLLLDEVSVDDYVPYEQRPETYIVPVVFALIFIVGIVGNGTLVVIFLRHRAMRNIPNTYIFSLALADLLVILICVPLASLIYTLESWPWGDALCRVSEFAEEISIGVSVFTLTALSADRYCAIVNPLRKLQTRPLTVIVAFLIWVLAIICAIPSAVISEVVVVRLPNKTIEYCSPFGPRTRESSYSKYKTVLNSIVYYFLPLSIIGILYVLMAHRLHTSAREMPGENAGPQSRSQARARRHVARMVITFVIVFIVCFLPHHVVELWFHLNPHAEDDYDDFWHIFRITGFCLSFLNSCINPVALYCVSGVFRQHFHRYLCCRPMTVQRRIGLSSAGNACETSFVSTIRRSQHHSIRKSLSVQSVHGKR
ncbi:neuropeptide CCHamide-2 receptor-like [Anopheles arabiensis]|uniref:neuropeptide CCHamide-2 receptor-like n=1 Tax=Anopheles arabiensis TaxID=7173 RepID=UPI001AADE742|nr:neuropeptide CCHamide-2 receptor-like [Anopheles arabiensis]XP_040155069.1 neuropeptide CCHamide-2 receptor-like [Anopheles arabiensis]XP_040155070.1 neuropeptide CCHamide-2 receptor-like [Anopheles arabiensis]XP_040226717.1 neuropeptide CCHamide-2 receptor-like [Anopheles coluzzii]XP_061501239.1 neuropeptide CCHamide-2 receptor [Anopheles gambiae]XP_061501240.1 neuropeptide CCHamide-2 receptor [Anopheles gambiae]